MKDSTQKEIKHSGFSEKGDGYQSNQTESKHNTDEAHTYIRFEEERIPELKSEKSVD
jgi:hypothetical protein